MFKLKDRQKELVTLCRKGEEEREALKRSLKKVRDEASTRLTKAKAAIEGLPALEAELQQLRGCRLHFVGEQAGQLRRAAAGPKAELAVLRVLATEHGPEEVSRLCSTVLRLQDPGEALAGNLGDDVSAWLSSQQPMPAAIEVAERLARLVIWALDAQTSVPEARLTKVVKACEAARSEAATEAKARHAAESIAAEAVQAKGHSAMELADTKASCAQLVKELKVTVVHC